jgi:hypothetical protein
MRYRVVAFAEQKVDDRWIQMSQTELATFGMSTRRNRDPTMPTRPPPPPPAAAAGAEDQVVPQQPPPAAAEEQEVTAALPEQSAEPRSDAPGAMRTPRRAREARVAGQSRRSPPLDLAGSH